MDVKSDRGGRVRPWLLGILVLGLAGTETELLLLKHYEEPLQWAPVVLIALTGGVLAWNAIGRGASSLRVLKVLMWLFLVAGLAGVALHFNGAVEFQLEINPDMARWELIKKAVQAQAPPFLAPGVMLQLGLIGLVYSHMGSGETRRETT
jgi:hypothetical protein